MTFTRITIDPAVCTGKPCIRGLRFPVARLLGLMAAGETRDAILKAYPYLEPGDIDEALRYAAFLAEDETVTLRPAVPDWMPRSHPGCAREVSRSRFDVSRILKSARAWLKRWMTRTPVTKIYSWQPARTG